MTPKISLNRTRSGCAAGPPPGDRARRPAL